MGGGSNENNSTDERGLISRADELSPEESAQRWREFKGEKPKPLISRTKVVKPEARPLKLSELFNYFSGFGRGGEEEVEVEGAEQIFIDGGLDEME